MEKKTKEIKEPKSLKVLQVFAAVGYVISYVLFVLSIVICALSLISGIFLLACRDTVFSGKTLAAWILEASKNNTNIYNVALAGFALAISSGGGIAVFCLAKKYLRHVKEDKNPFTYSGAKEALRLGIISLSVDAGCLILSAIVFMMFIVAFPDQTTIRFMFFEFGGFFIGLVSLLLSFIFRYGADLRNQKAK